MSYLRRKLDKDALKKKTSNLLYKRFDAAACKTTLNLTIPRLKIMRNKNGVQLKALKKEIAKYLEADQEDSARVKVERVIREEKLMSAYELIELYCETIVARLQIIDSQKECPTDLKEAITGVIYAQQRCSDLVELKAIRKHLTHKYGKDFANAAAELRPGSGVSTLLVEKLSLRTPNAEEKVKALTKIATEHNIDWKPKSFEEETEPKKTSLSGATAFESAEKLFSESAKPVAVQVVQKPEPVPTPVQVQQVPSNQVSSGADSSSSGAPIISGIGTSAPGTTPQKKEGLNVHAEEQISSPRQQYRKTAAAAAEAAARSAELANMAAIAAAKLAAVENDPEEEDNASGEYTRASLGASGRASLQPKKPEPVAQPVQIHKKKSRSRETSIGGGSFQSGQQDDIRGETQRREHDGSSNRSNYQKEQRNRGVCDGRSSSSSAISSSEAIRQSDLHPENIAEPSSPYNDHHAEILEGERRKDHVSRSNLSRSSDGFYNGDQCQWDQEKQDDDARDLFNENAMFPKFGAKSDDVHKENARVSQGHSPSHFNTSPFVDEHVNFPPSKRPSSEGMVFSSTTKNDYSFQDHLKPTFDDDDDDDDDGYARKTIDLDNIASSSKSRDSTPPFSPGFAGPQKHLSEPTDDLKFDDSDDSDDDTGKKIEISINWGGRSSSPKPELPQPPLDREESKRPEVPYQGPPLEVPPARWKPKDLMENLDGQHTRDEAKIYGKREEVPSFDHEDPGQQTLDLNTPLQGGERNRYHVFPSRRTRRTGAESSGGKLVSKNSDQVVGDGGTTDQSPAKFDDSDQIVTRDDKVIHRRTVPTEKETPRPASLMENFEIERPESREVPEMDKEMDPPPPRPRRRTWGPIREPKIGTPASQDVDLTAQSEPVKKMPLGYSSSSTDTTEMENKEASKHSSSAADPNQSMEVDANTFQMRTDEKESPPMLRGSLQPKEHSSVLHADSSSSSSRENTASLTSTSKREPKPKHVHPKLPDYDSFAANFNKLRGNTRSK